MRQHWIARDKDGTLNIYNYQPTRDEEEGMFLDFDDEGLCFTELPNCLFPEVTWENSPSLLVPYFLKDEEDGGEEKGKEDS